MTASIHDLLTSVEIDKPSREHPERHGLIRIRRGIYAPVGLFSFATEAWEVRDLASILRAFAVQASCRDSTSLVFTSEIALKLQGSFTWMNTPDIVFRRADSGRSHHPKTMAPLTIRGAGVFAVQETELQSIPITNEVLTAQSVSVLPAWAAAIDCARVEHPLIGITAVSSALHAHTRFDRREPARGRAEEAELKRSMLDCLDSMAGYRGVRLARELVLAGDAGIENPGEAFLLWLLHCLLTSSPEDRAHLVTQFHIPVGPKNYYPDIALPQRKVLFEFDGKGKIGGNEIEFLTRQNDLLAAGWRPIRVNIGELKAPNALSERLTREMRKLGIPASPPSGKLWKPPTADIMDARRRH